ncbi:hypothetical protein N9L68_02900 [bacterium]|nr:hypothetical protein [bacterium]
MLQAVDPYRPEHMCQKKKRREWKRRQAGQSPVQLGPSTSAGLRSSRTVLQSNTARISRNATSRGSNRRKLSSAASGSGAMGHSTLVGTGEGRN